MPGVEIIFIPGIIFQVIGKQDMAYYKIEHDIADDEQVFSKHPVADLIEINLPPPEMKQEYKNIKSPQEVDPVGL